MQDPMTMAFPPVFYYLIYTVGVCMITSLQITGITIISIATQ